MRLIHSSMKRLSNDEPAALTPNPSPKNGRGECWISALEIPETTFENNGEHTLNILQDFIILEGVVA